MLSPPELVWRMRTWAFAAAADTATRTTATARRAMCTRARDEIIDSSLEAKCSMGVGLSAFGSGLWASSTTRGLSVPNNGPESLPRWSTVPLSAPRCAFRRRQDVHLLDQSLQSRNDALTLSRELGMGLGNEEPKLE